MSDTIRANNVTWHNATISRTDREKANGHRAAVIWFTGLSASGKSTLALAVECALAQRGCRTYVLDGDNVRHGLNKDLGFSPQDREENIRRIGEVAKLFVDAGVIAMTAFISPYRADRDKARALNACAFIDIYVKCGLDVCEQRDPKGLYKKARAGEIPEFKSWLASKNTACSSQTRDPVLDLQTGNATEMALVVRHEAAVEPVL